MDAAADLGELSKVNASLHLSTVPKHLIQTGVPHNLPWRIAVMICPRGYPIRERAAVLLSDPLKCNKG